MKPYKLKFSLLFLLLLTNTLLCMTPAWGQQPAHVKNDQLVSIDFNNVDIGVFIKFISDLTKKNFIIDDRVKGKVSIISPGKITVSEAYTVFESVLEVHGFAAVPAGEVIKIVSTPDARTKNIKTQLEEESGVVGDTVVTQIIPLRYADPNEIKRLFTPLVSKSSIILAYAPTNTLIITDVQSNINRLLNILKTIDITGVGQQIAIIPVEYADATKLVSVLTSVFKTTKKTKGGVDRDITFVADERTNVIIALASEGDTESVRKLVRSLDKETPKGQAKIHVYYLEHANAEDLASVLQDIPKKSGSGTEKGGKPTAPVVSDKTRISADKSTNSLIIMADMEDYLVLEDIIRKVDIPRSMVYIEALFMEVDVNKDFRLGSELLAGGETSLQDKDAIYAGGFGGGQVGKGDDSFNAIGPLNAAVGNTVSGLLPGFSVGLFGESIEVDGIKVPTISAIFQAYKKDTDVNILSTPQILTTDNQEAKIYVGKNVPFQTQAAASSSSVGEVYNSYEYRDVGKTLTITPHISKDRKVRLEISLEISALESEVDNRPTTLKRTVETTAIVNDRHTVVLGGLIDNTISTTDYKVPCLGDIPVLGWLFRSVGESNDKTNLYVFLTPRVIENNQEASEVYSQKRKEITDQRGDVIKLFPYKSSEPPPNPLPPADVPNPENKQPSPTSTIKSDTNIASDEIGYTIQVTSVQSQELATQLLEDLTGRGFPAYTVRSEVDGRTWYRLRVGYYKTANEAIPVIDKLRTTEFEPILIKI
jgi:general secretion pathway protein D